ncbi:MAG: copper homeostasis protein CutC [Alloprevotella sp.]|nr:copper homeostasis protein CutC [Alloprevotella sp.]
MAVLEICCGTIDDVVAAQAGGADRVELCAALGEGGVTPSAGFLELADQVKGLCLHAIVRPRGGEFLYSAREKRCMLEDIRFFASFGLSGIVVGALTAAGDVDTEFVQACVEEAGGCSVTFHRAFDVCREPARALEDIIRCGCDRLLTSGQAPTAEAGIPLLQKLVAQADGRISIMPGCGVTPANAAHILRQTGATELHASASSLHRSTMQYSNAAVRMGRTDADEYSRKATDPDIVRRLREAISTL